MGQDATQVRVGVTGALYMAPVATANPANTSGGWPAGWVDLGILDEGGPPAELHPIPTTKDIFGWQQFLPVRTIKTGQSLEWHVKLIQKTGTNLKLAFGGGTIASLGGGDYKYTLPLASAMDEHAFGLEVDDGSIIDRYLLPRAMVAATAPIIFRRDEAVKFDLTIRALAPSGAPGGNFDLLVSNDPAMAS